MTFLMKSHVVHLELRTRDPAAVCLFYRRLFGWRAEAVHLCRDVYISLSLGGLIDGGVAEDDRSPPAWLPYVEVPDAREAVSRAEALGARVVVAPRAGPAGWRAVIAAPDGAEIALWQPVRE
jgi:predicted enzyme related to lactoylglutathione lyase